MSFDNAIADGYVKVNSGDVSKFKALEVLVPVKKAKEEKSAKTDKKLNWIFFIQSEQELLQIKIRRYTADFNIIYVLKLFLFAF